MTTVFATIRELRSTVLRIYQEEGYNRRLNTALNGLKQAAREYCLTLNHYIIKMGCHRVDKDQSVYVHKNSDVIGIYEDDLLLLEVDR